MYVLRDPESTLRKHSPIFVYIYIYIYRDVFGFFLLAILQPQNSQTPPQTKPAFACPGGRERHRHPGKDGPRKGLGFRV